MSAFPGNTFNPTDRILRQFAAIWIVFFGAIAARQEFYHGHHTVALALAAAALTIGPLGLVWPRVIRPVFVTWMTLAYPIGWIVSRIVLGTIFYGLITPVAAILRLIGRDALELKPQPAAPTYWRAKPGAAGKKSYLSQF